MKGISEISKKIWQLLLFFGDVSGQAFQYQGGSFLKDGVITPLASEVASIAREGKQAA